MWSFKLNEMSVGVILRISPSHTARALVAYVHTVSIVQQFFVTQLYSETLNSWYVLSLCIILVTVAISSCNSTWRSKDVKHLPSETALLASLSSAQYTFHLSKNRHTKWFASSVSQRCWSFSKSVPMSCRPYKVCFIVWSLGNDKRMAKRDTFIE